MELDFSMAVQKYGNRDPVQQEVDRSLSFAAPSQIHCNLGGCNMNPQRMAFNRTCLIKVKERAACSAEISSAEVPLKPKCYLLRVPRVAILLKTPSYESTKI